MRRDFVASVRRIRTDPTRVFAHRPTCRPARNRSAAQALSFFASRVSILSRTDVAASRLAVAGLRVRVVPIVLCPKCGASVLPDVACFYCSRLRNKDFQIRSGETLRTRLSAAPLTRGDIKTRRPASRCGAQRERFGVPTRTGRFFPALDLEVTARRGTGSLPVRSSGSRCNPTSPPPWNSEALSSPWARPCPLTGARRAEGPATAQGPERKQQQSKGRTAFPSERSRRARGHLLGMGTFPRGAE